MRIPSTLAFVLIVGCLASGSCGRKEKDAPAAPLPSDRLFRPESGSTRPEPLGAWESVPSLNPKPSLPCAMVAARGELVLATESRLAAFDPAKKAWNPLAARLPHPVGSGVSLLWDEPRGRLFIFAGASRDFWSWQPGAGDVTALASTPAPVGRGGFLASAGDRVYAVRGDRTRDIWTYDPAANEWSPLPRVAGSVTIADLGNTTGFLAGHHDKLYAWPDHHTQRFDIHAKTWGDATWSSMGFRPHYDGGGLAFDHERGEAWFAQGRGSRTLGVYLPESKQFFYVRPRSPELLTGEGSRIAILPAEGRPFLWLYVPEPSNRFWRIPLDAVERITQKSPASDVGSPFSTLHEGDGASLVRHEGIEGAMGAMASNGEFWFMRLRNVRFLNPVTQLWTRYPGIDVGQPMTAGLCGENDGGRGFYWLDGGARDFFHLERDDDHPKAEPPAPAPTGLGARIARVGRILYVLRGGNTREFWMFDSEHARWEALPSLPDSSPAIGDDGTGLVSDAQRVFAFAGTDALEFDASTRSWKTAGRLGFACAGDGGMSAVDPSSHLVYLVRGAGTREIGRFDPSTGRFEHLSPDLPDVVSVDGNRLVITTEGGRSILYLFRGHDSHEMLRVPIESLTAR